MYDELRELYRKLDEIIEDLHFTRCNSCNGHCCKPNEFGEKPKVSPGEKHLIEEFLKDNNPYAHFYSRHLYRYYHFHH